MRKDIAEYLNWSKENIEKEKNIKNDGKVETALYRKNVYIPIIINTNGEDVCNIIKDDFKKYIKKDIKRYFKKDFKESIKRDFKKYIKKDFKYLSSYYDNVVRAYNENVTCYEYNKINHTKTENKFKGNKLNLIYKKNKNKETKEVHIITVEDLALNHIKNDHNKNNSKTTEFFILEFTVSCIVHDKYDLETMELLFSTLYDDSYNNKNSHLTLEYDNKTEANFEFFILGKKEALKSLNDFLFKGTFKIKPCFEKKVFNSSVILDYGKPSKETFNANPIFEYYKSKVHYGSEKYIVEENNLRREATVEEETFKIDELHKMHETLRTVFGFSNVDFKLACNNPLFRTIYNTAEGKALVICGKYNILYYVKNVLTEKEARNLKKNNATTQYTSSYNFTFMLTIIQNMMLTFIHNEIKGVSDNTRNLGIVDVFYKLSETFMFHEVSPENIPSLLYQNNQRNFDIKLKEKEQSNDINLIVAKDSIRASDTINKTIEWYTIIAIFVALNAFIVTLATNISAETIKNREIISYYINNVPIRSQILLSLSICIFITSLFIDKEFKRHIFYKKILVNNKMIKYIRAISLLVILIIIIAFLIEYKY